MKAAAAFFLAATAALAVDMKVLQSGDGTGIFPIYVLGDGWRQEDMPQYEAAVEKMLGDLWGVEPYGYFKHIFTIKRYNVVSNEKGCAVFEPPASITDDEERKKMRERKSALHVTFQKVTEDPNLDSAFAEVDKVIGDGEKEGIAIILLNMDVQMAVTRIPNARCYIALPANSPVDASGILAHEMGHGFFRLGDEYCTDRTYKSEPANLTKLSDPDQVKWSHIVRAAIPCSPLPGGKAGLGGFFHAFNGCRMNQAPYTGGFCRVCLEGMTQSASETYTPVASRTPRDSWITVHPFSDITFTVNMRGPTHEYAKVWLLNGRRLGAGTVKGTSSSITLSWYNLFPAYNKVQFLVEDRRNVVSPELKPIGKAPHTVEWSLFSLVPPQPVPLVQKVVSWLD